jgi:hypothetical protein
MTHLRAMTRHCSVTSGHLARRVEQIARRARSAAPVVLERAVRDVGSTSRGYALPRSRTNASTALASARLSVIGSNNERASAKARSTTSVGAPIRRVQQGLPSPSCVEPVRIRRPRASRGSTPGGTTRRSAHGVSVVIGGDSRCDTAPGASRHRAGPSRQPAAHSTAASALYATARSACAAGRSALQ